MCLLSSVSLFLFSCLKDIWWFPYLALKLFAVRPMYVSVFSVVTVAWYTTSSTIHSPFSGQSSFFLQLHFLPSFYLRMYFRRCLQVDMSSLPLFKVAMCGLDIIKNFSEMHKLHRLVRVVYALAFARIFHVIVKSFFFSFNCHRYLLSSVKIHSPAKIHYFTIQYLVRH